MVALVFEKGALCLLRKTVSAMLLLRVSSRFLLLLISVIETEVPGSVTKLKFKGGE
jgi:hypothetical protein